MLQVAHPSHQVEPAMRAALPSLHMLVEAQYALEELMAMEERLTAALAGLPMGKPLNSEPLVNVISGQPMGMRSGFAHIRLQGMMTTRDSYYSSSVTNVVDAINAAYQDDSIAGILLEVNTGGGEVVAGQMMSAALMNRPKPVVTLGHLVASGGIMATMHSDEIVASGPMASFGSIGVMRTVPKFVYRYYSSYYQELYSDLSPNKNAGHREYTEKGTMAAWMEELNDLARAFQDEMKAARPLQGNVQLALSGQMFRAREAKKLGLVDSEGGYQYAITRLGQLARRNNQQL